MYSKQTSTLTQWLLYGLWAMLLTVFSMNALAEEEFLHPDEAFKYSVEATAEGDVYVSWRIAPHYYLYKHQLDVADDNGSLITRWPDGEFIEDEFFGRSEVFFNEVTVQVEPGDASHLTLRWQGCAEAGLCYPPQEATVAVPAPGSSGGFLDGLFGTNTNALSSSASVAPVPAAPVSDQGEDQRLAERLAAGNVAWAVAAFFGLGLLLVFTPCVLPMLPVLSSLVVGSESRGRSAAFILSMAYVVPMAFAYAVMGVVAAMAGANLQAVLQQPAVLAVFAGVFVLLAAAMFGLYELQLPAWLRDCLNNMSQKQQGGTLWGAALMGVLSAILVGPCMTAPLAGALLYIAESGNVWFGGVTLFALGLGMGAPLVLAMTLGAGFLPKPGGWMNGVKVVFGFMLLGLAIWFVQRVVPGYVVLALSGLLGIAMAYTLWHSSRSEGLAQHPAAAVLRATALCLGVWSTLMVVGGAAGSKDPIRPLHGIVATGGSVDVESNFMSRFHTMTTEAELDRALAQAQQDGRWAIVDYYADWCISCHVIEREVFGNAEVQAALDNVVLLRPDVTAPGKDSQALLNKYGILGPPTILFIAPNGEERRGQRVVGELSARAFLDRLHTAQGN